ncbi:MAG: DUF2971 domain-containing protein [Cognatishimia sp.]|uniref:DUF2971 domain-containing protein n=1 Tax=Cognatishimia sp. TaxID=2211648 RepID=UPI00405884C9
MRLFKFIGAQHVFESLLFKRIKVSKPTEVNDPFEFCPFSFPSKLKRRAWRQGIIKAEKETGFISFSTNWESPALWANYAENHKGACLEFEVDQDAFRMPGKSPDLVEVTYKDELREFNYNARKDPSILAEYVRYALATKSKHWEYEDEWRLLVNLDDCFAKGSLHFRNFDQNFVLKKVILGYRSEFSSDEIRGAFGSALIVETARPAFNSYKMTKQHAESMQK